MRRHAAALLCACFALLLVASASSAANPPPPTLEATLSRNWVSLGETFELVLRAVGDATASPDLTPLERDFHVGGVNRVSHTTVSNGQLSKSQAWHVQLRARRDGKFTIPPLEIPGVAGSASAPLALEVAAAAQRRGPAGNSPRTAADLAPSVFVEAEVDRKAPYVQGQVLLRVRIGSDRPLLSGSLTEPQVSGASLERMGEDRSYEKTIDGRRHRIIEREYAIFPQQSGEMRIPPIEFEGRVRAPAAQRGRARPRSGQGFRGSPFDALEEFMGDGFFRPRGQKRVRAQTEELVLDVQARPKESKSRWWLPASELRLSEEWDREPETLQVGEQVTRQFVIQAYGVSRDQIPEIELPDVRGVKQYAEPAGNQTVRTQEGLASIKVQKTVVIATEPGEVVLPAVELAWWDTAEDRERVARLPERRIRVVAGDAELAAAPPPSGTGGTPGDAGDTSTATAEHPESMTAGAEAGSNRRLWLWVALCLGVVGALLFAVLRRRSVATPRALESTRRRLRNAERALNQACLANDAEAAAKALCDVAAARSPDGAFTSPGAFAERLGDDALRTAIEWLQAARFGSKQSGPWTGAALWEAYEQSRQRSKERPVADDEVLPSLYPSAGRPARS